MSRRNWGGLRCKANSCFHLILVLAAVILVVQCVLSVWGKDFPLLYKVSKIELLGPGPKICVHAEGSQIAKYFEYAGHHGAYSILLEEEPIADGDPEWDIFAERMPFGIKNAPLESLRKIIQEFRTPAPAGSATKTEPKACHDRCIVVGNGGSLADVRLGKEIDSHDVIIRLNAAPTSGFEQNVGRKTHVRIFYPESADIPNFLEEDLEETSFVVALFQKSYFPWLEAVANNSKISRKVKFWKKPGDPTLYHPHRKKIRILNPRVFAETRQFLRRKAPSTGFLAVNFAAHICDTVDIVGFSYSSKTPSARLHYYENLTMDARESKLSRSHDADVEARLLKKFVDLGFLNVLRAPDNSTSIRQ